MVAEATTPQVEALKLPDALPVLPLRGNTVVFPLAVVPLMVGQPGSVQLVDDAMRRERLLVLVPQHTDTTEQPGPDELSRVGTAGIIHQLMRAPDGTLRVVVQGLERVRLLDFVTTRPYLVARVELAPDQITPGVEIEALRRAVVDLFGDRNGFGVQIEPIRIERLRHQRPVPEEQQMAFRVLGVRPDPVGNADESG